MLEVDIQKKIYKIADGTTLEAIEGIKFKLESNTFTCIVGPSGCGKTTTLRAILGLDIDFTGNINFNEQRGGTGRVAAVFQEPRLLPWRRVEDNVRLAMPHELKDQSLSELFSELGIEHVKQFFPSELSLGLARRVALARAYALEPELLILDEPFVSLDDATADHLRQLLSSLCQSRPTTSLMVTHNLSEAATLADRIIVLSARPSSILEDVSIDILPGDRTDKDISDVINYIKSVQALGVNTAAR
ncbi:MAG: ABC transporter ATP-binding protein [Gammaproteobacteria bacterium]|nr:ABC transporter ATP-binding protein [Gammaproteobacteria bacterium]